MAPEVLCCQNHSFAVDYFAVGVIGYEFMRGRRPYHGKNRKEIKENVLSKEVKLVKEEMPKDWSIESADFINRCLQRKPSKRLGARGAAEIKEHSWFKYYPWKDLYLQKLKSPFIPPNKDNFDEKHCNSEEPAGIKTIEKYIKIISSSKYNKIFNNFNYFNREETDNESQSTHCVTKKFKNPHLIYYEVIENSEGDFDASVINRNILKGNNMEKELFSQMSKIPRIRLAKDISFSAKKNKGKNLDSRNKKNYIFEKFSTWKNDDNKGRTMNLSFGGMKKLSKESGFGY